VADELGKAILKIEVQDGEAIASLAALKKQIGEVNSSLGKASRSSGTGRASGGARDNTLPLERAKTRLFTLQQRINALEAKGVDVSRARARLEQASLTRAQGNINAFRLQDAQLDRYIRKLSAREKKERAVAQELTNQSNASKVSVNQSPIRGSLRDVGSAAFATRGASQGGPGSPAFLKERAERRSGIASNALIGGAFPLLFGQGLGASIGGAGGGALGGAFGGQFGFGGSLIGTVIGAQFDLILQKGRLLAQGMDDPIGKFEELKEAGLLSSKSLEKQVDALNKVGRTAEASTIIQQDLLKTFGSQQGVKSYSDAIDTLNRAWGQATTVLGAFIAGPLANLIKELSKPVGNFNVAVRFEQLAGQLTPEQYAQVDRARVQATEQSRNARGGISAFLPPSEDDVRVGRQAGIKEAERLLGIEQQRVELANKLIYARALTAKQERDAYKQITASVQGYKDQEFELQKQEVLRKRNSDLLALPANASPQERTNINKQAALDLFGIEERRKEAQQERLITQGEINAKSAIELEAVRRQIGAARELAATSGDRSRSELQRRQQIVESINAAKDAERLIGSQIDAARQRGGDAGEQEALRLVGEQKKAAEFTKLKLIEGADALKQAGKALSEDLTSAVLKLTEVRSDPGGLNRFLSPADQQKRAENDFQTLLPQFRQAQEKFRGLTGANAPEFSGSTQDVNASIRDFIGSVQKEFDATNNVGDVQKALASNTASLAYVNSLLLDGINALAGKQWAVNVAVNADGSSAAYGDVLNRAI